MNLKQLLCVLSICLYAAILPLSAGNSIFSFDGTPCQNYGNDIYGMSMGDVGVSDVFRKNTGYGNPAMLGSTNQTLFSTGMQFGWTGYKSDSGKVRSFRDNSLDFPYFSIATPYNRHHFGFQFNSMASGVAGNQETIDVDGTDVVMKQFIDRYIYRADLIYAYSFKNINLGLGLNYYFGHDAANFRAIWPGDADFANTNDVSEQTYKNPTATLGMTAKYKTASVGAYFTKGVTLQGKQTFTTIHETEDLGTFKYVLPNHVAFGVTEKLMNAYKISSDFQIDLWEMENNAMYDKNSWKLGIGLAQEPGEHTSKTFVGQMPKRVGFSYRVLPFEANNNPISGTAVTTGITLPLKNYANQIDLGIQYLWRGNVADNKLQDRSLMFMFGITGFDVLTRDFKRTAPREIPKAEELSE